MSEELKKEIAELCKEVNGKLIQWKLANAEEPIQCILLATPDKDLISIKPYGYTNKQLLKRLHQETYTLITLEQVSHPTFCLATVSFTTFLTDEISLGLKFLAECEENSIVSFSNWNSNVGVNPVCPY